MLGKTNWASDPQCKSVIYDELKIYSRGLNQSETLKVK